MRLSEIIFEATVQLSDMYSDSELDDKTEAMHSYIDDSDLTKDFTVKEMSPAEAKTYVTSRDDMPVYDAFKRFASKDQKKLVKDKVLNFDKNRIILTINKTVLDGNHQLIAGIIAKMPIKFIDLAE